MRAMKGTRSVCVATTAVNEEGERFYEILVLSARKIRRVHVTAEALRLVRDIPYSAVVGGVIGSIACVANTDTYDLIDLENQQKIPLMPIVQGDEDPDGDAQNDLEKNVLSPLICPVERDFLLATGTLDNTGIGLFVNCEGDITRSTLIFPGYPIGFAYREGRVFVSLEAAVEVYEIASLEKVETFAMQRAQIEVGNSLLYPSSYLIEQLALCVGTAEPDDNSLTNAKQMSVMSTDFVVCDLHGVITAWSTPSQTEVLGSVLREQDSIQAAIDGASLLEKSQHEIHEAEVSRVCAELKLFYQRLAFTLLRKFMLSDALDYMKKSELDPLVFMSLFSEFKEAAEPIMQLYNGLRSFLPESVNSLLADVPAEAQEFVRSDYYLILERYLVFSRTSSFMPAHSMTIRREVIDHALLKIYATSEYDKLCKFISEGNIECRQDKVVKLLEETNNYYALSIYYKTKGLNRDMLDIWIKLLEGDSLHDEHFVNGERMLVKELKATRDDGLVWEYGLWLLRHRSQLGVEVLRRYDPIEVVKQAETKYGWEGALPILEHMMFNEHSNDAELANKLAYLYTDQLNSWLKGQSLSLRALQMLEDYAALLPPKPGFFQAAESSSHGQDIDSLIAVEFKLVSVIESSRFLDAEALLARVEKEPALLYVSAVLNGRLKHHKEALRMLLEMKDVYTAEKYCYFCGSIRGMIPDTAISALELLELRRELFTELMRQLFAISDDDTFKANFIRRWGQFMRLRDVLLAIPDSWSVKVVAPYFMMAFEQLLSTHRQQTIIKNLARSSFTTYGDLVKTIANNSG